MDPVTIAGGTVNSFHHSKSCSYLCTVVSWLIAWYPKGILFGILVRWRLCKAQPLQSNMHPTTYFLKKNKRFINNKVQKRYRGRYAHLAKFRVDIWKALLISLFLNYLSGELGTNSFAQKRLCAADRAIGLVWEIKKNLFFETNFSKNSKAWFCL